MMLKKLSRLIPERKEDEEGEEEEEKIQEKS